MSWNVIGASIAGSSHVRSSLPCQDNCFYQVVTGKAGTEILVALVSDGAGSAQFGEVGSEIACETGGKVLLDIVETGGEVTLEASIASTLLKVVRTRIEEAAETRGVSARALACTLLGAVVGPNRALYFQIGDGAMISREKGTLSPVFWPESGEYANMTYFVTDADATERLRIDVRDAPDELSLFSDGIQRLALVYATGTAHEPFFEPMFSVLRTSTDEHTDSLCAALERFLNSNAINERTDDDKTLILATRSLRATSVASV